MTTEKATVLIVDDVASNIQILFNLLRDDYEVIFATSGADALALAAQSHPDLILLDIMMPEMDGHEVCRRLKADPLTADIPVIFISAMGEENDEAHGLGLGVIDYLTKPLRPAIVKARVRNHILLKRQSDQLRRLSLLDGLTGIPNRRQFDQVLAQEWRRGQRSGEPLGLVMADIDCFKQYNDHHGHLAGDDCLRRVAAALVEQINRAGDLVARFGGEEFVCLLPNTDLEGARALARRLGEGIEALALPHAASAVGDHVTLSAGVAATVAEKEQKPSALIEQADAALYRAKAQGRNRVAG